MIYSYFPCLQEIQCSLNFENAPWGGFWSTSYSCCPHEPKYCMFEFRTLSVPLDSSPQVLPGGYQVLWNGCLLLARSIFSFSRMMVEQKEEMFHTTPGETLVHLECLSAEERKQTGSCRSDCLTLLQCWGQTGSGSGSDHSTGPALSVNYDWSDSSTKNNVKSKHRKRFFGADAPKQNIQLIHLIFCLVWANSDSVLQTVQVNE